MGEIVLIVKIIVCSFLLLKTYGLHRGLIIYSGSDQEGQSIQFPTIASPRKVILLFGAQLEFYLSMCFLFTLCPKPNQIVCMEW